MSLSFLYLLILFSLFMGTLSCLLIRHNILILLIFLEFTLLCLNILFIMTSCYLDDIAGFFFNFYMLTIAGVDAVFGLSLVISLFRLYGMLNLRYLSMLKG